MSPGEVAGLLASKHLRRLRLVAFLLAASTSDTAGFGAALGDLDLAAGHGQRVFARAATFPWNSDGSSRGIRARLRRP